MTLSALSFLRIVSWVLIAFGVAIAAAVILRIEPLLDLFFRIAFGGAVPGEINAPARLTAGVAGGVLAGWGVTLLALSRHALPSGADWARRAMLTSLALWFVLDSSASASAGAHLNIVWNAGFLVAFGAPLWRLGATKP